MGPVILIGHSDEITGDAKAASVRTWQFDDKDVTALREAIPGKVFVTCHTGAAKEANAGKTIVQATGADADLARIEAHVRLHKMGGKVLDLAMDAHAAEREGRILMEVFLDDTSPLTSITSSGASTLVLEDGTLSTRAVSIHKAGSGHVFVNVMKEINVQELFLKLTGTGAITVLAPRLQAHDLLDASVSGSGRVGLHIPRIHATNLSCSVTGSGSVLFDAANLISKDVISTVVGSGTVRYLHAGIVDRHRLSVTGSGKILSSAILASSAHATVAGSGDVVTQAMDILHGTIAGSGTVQYVAPVPAAVRVDGNLDGKNIRLVQHKDVGGVDAPAVPARDTKAGIFFNKSLFGIRFLVDL
ncbi:Aste57867_13824 [Aphanomyces stellatus]|uniref:Aste57867_13824 protein n=1 Tax=Aphanomyces stellatus TaxID=120398 RepID=A0A485L0U2_9STRA|nr:hypothetical protein As57867_013774 [Aphanomyces stellatus]VFT90656.1 Aste57867_13824 [Aphanomyces stellatus]